MLLCVVLILVLTYDTGKCDVVNEFVRTASSLVMQKY